MDPRFASIATAPSRLIPICRLTDNAAIYRHFVLVLFLLHNILMMPRIEIASISVLMFVCILRMSLSRVDKPKQGAQL